MSDCLTLKKSNCKNCYKCIRHCPVKSIRFSGNQAYIIGNECILCGQCFVVCPQDAKQIVDESEKVRVLLQSGDPVIVSLAPSFVANYDGVGIGSMRKALKQLGFYDAEETAIGATIVKKEYERMVAEGDRNVIITSCCHSINLLIQKYYPSVLPYLADVMSPMQAHCTDIKKRYPDAKTVFIGPCVAKKDEAQYYDGIVDAVLTFDELTEWLKNENIELEKEIDSDENSRARFFPTTGGILLSDESKCFAFLAGHESFAAAEGAIGIVKNANKARKQPLRVILNGLGKDAAQIISRINGFTYVQTQFDYYTGKLNIVREIRYSETERADVRCYGADDVREGVAIMHHEGVDVSITGNSTNPTRFQHPVAGTYKKECIEQGKKYFSVASGGGTGRTLHPDNMAAGPASYGMTDTMGRMHSDAQFAGSSSVPAHVEMMGFLGMGNNPMVGATVAVTVAVEEAVK